MNNQIHHHSPKTQNNFFHNYYLKSPSEKDINIINFNNNVGVKPFNPQFNYSNINNCNYYAEITKAFNFITSILKHKDSQIKELRKKIKELERQLNDINETHIMTFNNKDINEIYSGDEKKNNTKINNQNNNLKKISCNYIPNKSNILYSNNNNKNNNNCIPNNSKIFSNNINIINRVKNSKNINKINNYRNNIELNNSKYNYTNNINSNNSKYLNTDENNRRIYLNENINEYSKDKNNINLIRKEPYNNNINNIKYRNKNNSGNKFRNIQTNETDTSTGNDKIKIFSIGSVGRANSKNSKSNSILTLSEEGITQSKTEIKNYLKEIKNKIEPDKFKQFVKLIKSLIRNKNSGEKNTIVNEIKNILIDKSLINKFETILKIKL